MCLRICFFCKSCKNGKLGGRRRKEKRMKDKKYIQVDAKGKMELVNGKMELDNRSIIDNRVPSPAAIDETFVY